VRGDGEYRSEDGLDLWSCTLHPYGDMEKQIRHTLCELRLNFLFLIISVRHILTFTTRTKIINSTRNSPTDGIFDDNSMKWFLFWQVHVFAMFL